MIPEDKVRDIKDTQSLLYFMNSELGWEFPLEADVDELTFEWTGAELSLGDDISGRFEGGVVREFRPLRGDQPWGIFLVDFTGSRVYATALRQVLRRLVAKKPDIPAWQCENILFICTTENQRFTFAHFRGAKPQHARLTTFSWEPQEPIRTICEFNLPALHYESGWDNEAWLKEWQAAFDVEKVTKRFFDDYRKVFKELQDILYAQITGESNEKEAKTWAHGYSLQFLNRLMFIYFIQKKRWLGDNPRFVRYFWDAYRGSKQASDTFFRDWLSVLFFEAFSNQYQGRNEYLKRFPEGIHQALAKAPFLNGGLFTRNELDRRYSFNIPDKAFELLFEEFEDGPGFFERYNFTISETTPLDQEVAVDPEMIGKVYESLVNITFEGLSEEDLRGSAGIFFTPRVEIDLMCRISLVDWLTNNLGDEYKAALYQAVFAYDPTEKEEADRMLASENLWVRLDELLRSITVLDPACGSGSFLVGMLLVIDDLIARADSQLGRKQTQFERRTEIIARSLYGVDVMPWAVHVAELRLWLQLVVETELEWWEMKAEPMLPNLSFKVRPGDSLVQEVGGINFGLHRTHLDISSSLKGRLTQLRGEKLKFYRNDPQAKFKSEAALKQEELNIFREILGNRAQKLDNEIKTLTQRIETPQDQAVMPGMEPKVLQAPLAVQQWRKERQKLTDELEQVQKTREALRTAKDIPFIWDIAFVEIFDGEKEGFDVVIGNPPYVRQQDIEDPQHLHDEATYKAELQQSVYAAYPTFFGYNPTRGTLARKIDGRSDYYIYFYLHGLKLLNDKGSFCFITSNSWLDVGYGKDLQELLLKHCHIKMILDNEKKRSFAKQDINTVIALLSPPDEKTECGLDRKARFVMFQVPFEEVLSPVVFQEIEEAERSSADPKYRQLQAPVFGTTEEVTVTELSRPEFRVRVVEQADLYKDGLASTGDKNNLISAELTYSGAKWGGKYIRAPEIFWTILEKGKSKLIRLGDIADALKGFITGANDFFYLEPMVKPALKGLVYIRNGAGWEGFIEEEFLKPVVKSPREIKTILIHPEDLRYEVFMCHLSKADLKKRGKTYAMEYIRWGELAGYDGRSGCSSREKWWDLGMRDYPTLFWPEAYNNRYLVGVNLGDYYGDQRLYLIRFKGNHLLLAAYLNSTITPLFIELQGIANLGQGAIYTNVYWLKSYPVLGDPSYLTPTQRERLEKTFDEMSKRDIKSIFEELGLPKPNKDYSNIDARDISLDKVLPDRRELDKVVFEALGVTEGEQLDVYKAVVELVKNRLVKAGSV